MLFKQGSSDASQQEFDHNINQINHGLSKRCWIKKNDEEAAVMSFSAQLIDSVNHLWHFVAQNTKKTR